MPLTRIKSNGITNGAVTSTQLASTISLSGNITGGNLIGPYANTTSNINIPTAGGNINLSVAGNANVAVITGTGINVAGTLNATGNITGGNFIGTLANTTSNISIPAAAGNVNISAAGNANIFTVTGTGANVSGNLAVSGIVTQSGANLATVSKAIAMSIVFGG